MFGFLTSPQARLTSKFKSSRKIAVRSVDPNERIASAGVALEIASQIESWPASEPPKRVAIGTSYGIRGQAYWELIRHDPAKSGLYDLEDLPNEFIGLPMGFLQAGAAAVIATLWPVEDLATALLLGRFYDAYVGAQLRSSAALREAQLWLRDASRAELRETIVGWRNAGRVSQGNAETALARLIEAPGADSNPYASPIFWSGFVHYGV